MLSDILIGLAAYQILPLVDADQIDICQADRFFLIRDVADTEDTLIPIDALAPESKDFMTQVQGVLGGVGMKGLLLLADVQKSCQFAKNARMHRRRVPQFVLQILL